MLIGSLYMTTDPSVVQSSAYNSNCRVVALAENLDNIIGNICPSVTIASILLPPYTAVMHLSWMEILESSIMSILLI